MKKNYFLWTLLILLVSVNAGWAQTYNLNSVTSEQFASGGTEEWSFERHDINAGTYTTFTTYGEGSTAVNYFDPYCVQRFGLYPIMNRPASGTQYEVKRNAWYSDAGEYLYVAAEYPDGTTVGDNLVYGENYPDTLTGYEVYSIANAGQSPKNSAITFTVPADGYYRADMKVIREDIFSSTLGQMKVYQFFRYGGEGAAFSMGKEFAYGQPGIDLWASENEALYNEYVAKVPESPSVNGNNGKPFRGLPAYSVSDYIYFYAHVGDKISFEADARSTGHSESTVRGAFARTKWLNLAVTVSNQETATGDARFVNPYESSDDLLDELWAVLDTAEYILTEEGPANGYSPTYLSQLEALYVAISQRASDGVIRSMEIPALMDQLWAAIELCRKPMLPTPVSGGYYVIKNFTTATYLGGATSGDGAVKHENAATNPYYHIFLLTGDNDNGYTFQQIASGLYVTHNNQWTGSYAAATNNNRQLFQYDNTTNPDYFIIKKKKDDGSFTNGIGFDNQTSGSTCYFDKGTDKWNTWLFDASEPLTFVKTELDTQITLAQAIYTANSEIAGASALQSAITDATATKNNSSATLPDYVSAINALKTSLQPLVLADQLRLAIVDAQTTLAANPTVDGAADFQTAINAAQTAYDASKSVYDATALTQAITNLAAAKAAFFLKVAEATGTVDSPAEITSLIVNPGFDTNADGWTANPAGSASQSEYELYNKTSIDFYQTITGLPVGLYKITVQGFHRSVGSNTVAAVDAYKAGTEVISAALYGNDDTSPLLSVYSDSITGTGWEYISGTDTMKFANSMGDARIAFDQGKYSGNAVFTFVSDGTLRLGIKNTATLQTNSWTVFDNFHLFYCGKEVNIAPYLEELQAAYDDAKTYYDAILAEEVAGASEGDVIGKYSYSNYTALHNALTAAKAILDANPATLTAEQVNLAKTTLLAAKAACVKSTGLNSLASGNYYILVNGEYYVTNPGNFETTGGKDYVISVALGSLVETQNTSDRSQIIKITKQDNGRYLFFSGLYEEGINNSGPDGSNFRNINENAAFRAEYSGTGELAWRTMNIMADGTNYAVQNAESSAAKGYWGYDATNQKLINGQSDAQYVFKFIPANLSGISVPKSDNTFVYAVDKNIRIVTGEKVNVSVYSLSGTLIANKIVSGTQEIPVHHTGLYIVKTNEKVVKVIVK